MNISKRGFSISFGVRGAHWTIGRRGHTGSVGIPGTGLFYRKHFSHENVTDALGMGSIEEEKKEEKRKGILKEFN